MKGKSHKSVTRKAFNILREIGDETSPLLAHDSVVAVVDSARETDHCEDLEFVAVYGAVDDPHKDELYEGDYPYYKCYLIVKTINFTAFNHYIDIKKEDKKEDHRFDDYDGYSYKKGSASTDEYQVLSDFTLGLVNLSSVWKVGGPVDMTINWLLKDNYVHAPGHQWYIKGKYSPSLERYSFPDGKMPYTDVEKKCEARFPMFGATNKENEEGVPWSVFMPVDNMAYYWHSKFLETGNPADLGPVMHAIQDASVPHHAAGYCGNWHHEYERDLQSKMPEWLADVDFTDDVKDLFTKWKHNDDDELLPSHLNVGDWRRKPAKNWRIDQLVTWVALNAYKEYDETYNHFRAGRYKFDEHSARNLVKIATAMSLLVLKNAADHLKSRP